MAESVAERVREIGVRIAVGARRSDVIVMVLGQGAWMIAAGMAIGVLGALALRQQLASLVFGVTTLDPVSYVLAALLLAAAALLACAVPARTAAACNPVVALRSE
jgi:ABC-type antimicrobial peptide transport system permease subunit